MPTPESQAVAVQNPIEPHLGTRSGMQSQPYIMLRVIQPPDSSYVTLRAMQLLWGAERTTLARPVEGLIAIRIPSNASILMILILRFPFVVDVSESPLTTEVGSLERDP